MYTLAIQRDFIAQSYTTGGSQTPRSHAYKAEFVIEAEELDQLGYVIDFYDLSEQVDELIGEYRDQNLNELDVFDGQNPSVERLSQVLCAGLDERLYAPNVTAISLKLWLGDSIWSAFDIER